MLVNETFKLVLHAQSKGKKMENPRVCLSMTVSIFIHEDSKNYPPGGEIQRELIDHWHPLVLH